MNGGNGELKKSRGVNVSFLHRWHVLIGVLGFFMISGCQSADVDTEEEDAVVVETAEAEIGDLEGTRIVNATTEALSEVSLTPEVTADVNEVLVEEGDQVEQGQVLARLDDSALRNTLEQERAALRSAQSNVAISQAGKRGAEAGVQESQASLNNADHAIRQAEEQYERAQIDLEQAKENYGDEIENAEQALDTAERNLATAERERNRSQQLFDEGLISKQELENAEDAVADAEDSVTEAENSLEQAKQEYNIDQLESQVESARSSLEEARDSKQEMRARIESSNASVDEASGSIEDARANVEQQETAVRQAEQNLEDAVVTAPSAGKILSVTVEPGEYYSQQDSMITIGEMNTLNVTASVTSEQLSSFEEGDEMEVRFPSNEETRTGTVTHIADSSDDNGMFNVEVQVDNPDNELRSGIYGEILLYETHVENGLLVPTEAIINVEGEPSIFIREENQAVLVPVEVVREESDYSAVEADIEEGTPVITRGQYFLEDGTAVEEAENEEGSNSSEEAEDETDSEESGEEEETTSLDYMNDTGVKRIAAYSSDSDGGMAQ